MLVTILVVEDNENVRRLTKTQLSCLYNIKEAQNGEEALDILDHESVDLLLVDIQMPEMDGYELLRTLRQSGDNTPAIMLTAMTSFAHEKEGFACGADDYVTKPIDYEKLVWRIEALLRRAKISSEKKIVIGDFSMDQKTYNAVCNGKSVALTGKEFDLLFKLLSYPETVFTKQQLMDDIWGYDTETDYDSIKTYISRLRNKFQDCKEFELVSLRGLGYKAVLRTKE